MAAGAALGWLVVGQAFGLVVGGCVLLSILYSHPLVRLKGRPGLDLLTNMAGYGAGTTLAGLLAGTAAYLGQPPGACAVGDTGFMAMPSFDLPALAGTATEQFSAAVSGGKGWLVAGFGLLFGSFYPATQIYQAEEDLARGDKTLATALGTRRALLLALLLGGLAGLSFLQGWLTQGRHWSAWIPVAGATVWVAHQARWWRQANGLASADHEKHMYTALTLWAVVDIAVLVGWFLRP